MCPIFIGNVQPHRRWVRRNKVAARLKIEASKMRQQNFRVHFFISREDPKNRAAKLLSKKLDDLIQRACGQRDWGGGGRSRGCEKNRTKSPRNLGDFARFFWGKKRALGTEIVSAEGRASAAPCLWESRVYRWEGSEWGAYRPG